MNYLKSSHFIYGKDNKTFYRSSASTTNLSNTAKSFDAGNWSSMRTNFALGSDKSYVATDYSTRYQRSASNANSKNVEDSKVNKAKCDSDQVKIGSKIAIIENESTAT